MMGLLSRIGILKVVIIIQLCQKRCVCVWKEKVLSEHESLGYSDVRSVEEPNYRQVGLKIDNFEIFPGLKFYVG